MYKSWMWKQRSYREQFQGDEGGGAAGGAGNAQGSADAAQNEGAAADEDAGGGQQDDHGGADGDAAAGAGSEEEGEVVIMLGDEPLPASNDDEIEGKPAPQWVKELRKQARELARENRELKQAQHAGQQQAAPAVQAVGEKPTLEGCDFDAEVYAEKLLAWTDAKRKADEAAAAARQEQEAAQAEWNKRLTTYNTAKAALRVDDFDGAEHIVRETMSQTQQGVILQGADKPELVIYALGRNPAKAKELAAIKDPVKFAFAVAKLETQLKVAPRKDAPPAPERQVRGTTGATSIDSTEARLEAEADKSGDRSKLIAYRREKRRQKAA
jgi:hypothetical protein